MNYAMREVGDKKGNIFGQKIGDNSGEIFSIDLKDIVKLEKREVGSIKLSVVHTLDEEFYQTHFVQ